VSTSAKRVFASQNQQREEILRDIGTLANSPLKDTAKIVESVAGAGAAAAKGSPKKAVHRSDASEDSQAKNSAPDFMSFIPQANGFGGPGGGSNMGALQGYDGVRASFDPMLPPSNFNLDGDSFWTSPPKQVPGKR